MIGASYAVLDVVGFGAPEANGCYTSGLGADATSEPARFLIGQALLEQLRSSGQPVRVAYHSAKHGLSHVSAPDARLQSFLGVMIASASQQYGMLYLINKRGAGEFSAEDEQIAATLAAQTAIAIQNMRLFEQVQDGRRRLQRLSEQLVRTQESERRQIARELHDEIGQSLTAAQLNLQVMIGLGDLSELPTRLADSLNLIDRVLQQVRALSLDLRPSMLDDLGLAPALRWYVKRQAERAGFSAEFSSDQIHERFAPDLETTCFRIGQEAVTNIVRYAQARHVIVRLEQQDQILHMTISDDGVGFDVEAALARAASGGSMGLISMNERAGLLGGRLHFESAPERGTTVSVQLPLAMPREDERPIERRTRLR